MNNSRFRRLLSFAAVLVLLLVGCNKAEWKEFHSTPGRFTVMLPGDPTEDSSQVTTAIGPVDVHMFHHDEIFLSFLVGYSDLPDRPDMVYNTDKMFDGSRNEVVRKVNARVISEQPITVDGNPGRLIILEKDNNLNMKIKLVWLRPRLYQVVIAANDIRAGSADIDRFMDSFKITQ